MLGSVCGGESTRSPQPSKSITGLLSEESDSVRDGEREASRKCGGEGICHRESLDLKTYGFKERLARVARTEKWSDPVSQPRPRDERADSARRD